MIVRRLHLAPLMALGSCMFMAAPWASSPQDPLWLKAVSGAERAQASGVVPGKLEMRATVKKPDGTVEDQSTVVFRIVQEGEESRTEIISATENGKDVTEEAKAEENKSEQKRKEKSEKNRDKEDRATIELEPGYHPFSPKVLARVTYQRVGETLLEGRPAALFTFRHASEDGNSALEGKAWLDLGTGAPLQVEVSPSPLPKHVDAMKSTVRFETTADGLWRPTTSEIKGEGGMLWIRKVFESSFRFSDWHKKEEPAGKGAGK
jgi:hypothetical protein